MANWHNATQQLTTGDGKQFNYDYLVVCAGPSLAFETVTDAVSELGFT